MDYTRCARISTNIIDRTQDPNGRGLDALQGIPLSEWRKATTHNPQCQAELDAAATHISASQSDALNPTTIPALLPRP